MAVVTDRVAMLELHGAMGVEHEGFVVSQAQGSLEYHWVRIQGVHPRTGSPASARLEAAPSLARLLGGPAAGPLEALAARLRTAPSVGHFMIELQEVVERLAYESGAGSGCAGLLRGGGAVASGSPSPGGGGAVLGALLADLDRIGWGALEEMEQDAARLTLLHVDGRGRQHRLRLTLPPAYPAAPPAAATDLPAPFTFAWAPPRKPAGRQEQQHGQQQQQRWRPAERGQEDGGGGAGGACSSIADVFEAFKQAVSRHQLLWSLLAQLDAAAAVLDPPPSVAAARRHLGPPARRVALGGAASLQLALDAGDPAGPPRTVLFMGPPEAARPLQEAYHARLHEWSRDRDLVENLEALLGQPLPPPLGRARRQLRGGDAMQGDADDRMGHEDGTEEEDDSEDGGGLAECAICFMHVLPVAQGEEGGEGGGGDGAWGEGVGAGGGAVPDVACPTPACGRPFHGACLAEWLRSLPDTRVSFNTLFGRCPFCSGPITVRS